MPVTSYYTDCPRPNCQHSVRFTRSQLDKLNNCPNCELDFYWNDAPYSSSDFVVFDLETTGLDTKHCEIIQIAAKRFDPSGNTEEDTFFSYVRPNRSIPYEVQHLTGISNRDVADAPSVDSVLNGFSKFVGNSTLIAHNAKRFDSLVLNSTMQRLGQPSRELDVIDSIHLSRMMYSSSGIRKHSLGNVLSRLNISSEGMQLHDARVDVHLLHLAVEAMSKQLGLDNYLNGVPRHQTRLPYNSLD